jgi:hypothetical protein
MVNNNTLGIIIKNVNISKKSEDLIKDNNNNNIKLEKDKEKDIILKTPIRNYSWDDLKLLSSM